MPNDPSQIHVVQLSASSWLVLDSVVAARWLIVEAPLVHKGTGETHVMHRVELWNPTQPRPVLSVHDGLEAAKAWCTEELAAEARMRARGHGLDPATGLPVAIRRADPA